MICRVTSLEGSPASFTISAELLRSIKMKRDMDVVRKVLKAIQDKPNVDPEQISVEGIDDFTTAYHVALLFDAGYIDGYRRDYIDEMRQVAVRGLTWAGHEFAGAILTDQSTWERLKQAIGPEKLVTLPIKVIEATAMAALTEWAKGKLGI